MRTFSPAFAAHIAGGATTLAWCWRITRADGVRQGFTDHDRDLSFDGTLFEAASGFTASEMQGQLGLGADNLEVTGAVSSGAITDEDLAAGRYDAAAIEIFRVNWQNPEQRALIRVGTLGEVRRAGTAFAAEVRGLAHALRQPKGRLFQFACDADLGDARCGVDLSAPAFRASATVGVVESARSFTASGLSAFADGWMTRGLLAFTSGANAGWRSEVRLHRKGADGTVRFELWQAPAEMPTAGEAFVVTAGCDKRLATCRDKFANVARFRGFPHVPGNDAIAAVVRRSG